MYRKGFATTAIILLIVIVLIIAGGVWYYEIHWAQSTPSPIGNSSSTPTMLHSVSSDDEAIAIVMKLPDVQEWMQAFPNGTSPTTGGHPGFAISSETTSTYVVWVFEDKPDQNVTFNYYDVNKSTGAVTSEE